VSSVTGGDRSSATGFSRRRRASSWILVTSDPRAASSTIASTVSSPAKASLQ
jgi:hypothetical protein